MKKDFKNEDRGVYGMVKVSDKGQIALPVDLRNAMDIERGDQFLVVRKENSNIIILIPADELMESMKDKFAWDSSLLP